MARRLHQSLTDYMVIAISPALIVTLIGSLVFFLLAILYEGNHDMRVRWIMAFFILGTVMIGRLSIEEGKQHAMLYGLPLALVTLLALSRFVQVSGPLAPLSFFINLGIMALIWWIAHKLTWDCTLIDDDLDGSGQGLLEQFGFDKGEVVESDSTSAAGDGETEFPGRSTSPRSNAEPAGPAWQRLFRRQRGGQQRPGMWVVYLSFAALPVFGFGHRMIPAGNQDLRESSFGLLYVYLASALGLLLTTSFLGLRRYLRQRRVEMPGEMAGMWLVAGSGAIVAVLAVCMLIPRRGSELPIVQIPLKLLTPDDRSTSDYAWLGEGQYDSDADRTGLEGDERRNGQEGGEPSGGDQRGEGRREGQGENSSGGESSEQGNNGDSGEQQRDGSAEQPSSDSDSQNRAGDKPPTDSQRDPDGSGDSPSRDDSRADGDDSRDERENARSAGERPPRQPPKFEPRRAVGQLAETLNTLIRVIFYAALIVALAYFAWKYRGPLRAAIADFLVWLRAMLGGKPVQTKNIEATAESARMSAPRSFADYPDPFRTGLASRMAADELVRYSFEALEAWAGEHHGARDPRQTPLEFVQRVAAAEPALAREAVELGSVYNRAAYAKSTLREKDIAAVRQFWQRIGQLPSLV